MRWPSIYTGICAKSFGVGRHGRYSLCEQSASKPFWDEEGEASWYVKITVTLQNVRDFVRAYLGDDADDYKVDNIASELDNRLNLVGEHDLTTYLRRDTVFPWIYRGDPGKTRG
ncbi:hypothetical protein [Mycobacterium colombiense]|uniref:hypothetical protein n=1 Tax=Mycobacterium colombiense TaxID=339268 RepID=UPI00096C52B2|nr:hypothetical protein [Mycobacterium colombiense]OMC18647.1 hypothetical protein A5737_03520 [Mycobacterium colombiense]